MPLHDEKPQQHTIRRLISANEITGLRFRCPNKKCLASVVLPLDGSIEISHRCPLCSEHWFDQNSQQWVDTPAGSVKHCTDPAFQLWGVMREWKQKKIGATPQATVMLEVAETS